MFPSRGSDDSRLSGESERFRGLLSSLIEAGASEASERELDGSATVHSSIQVSYLNSFFFDA